MAEAKEVEYAATLASVREAHDRIRPFVNLTPVMTSSTMDRLSGLELFFKCKHGIERAPAPSSPVHLRTQHGATLPLPIEAHTRVATAAGQRKCVRCATGALHFATHNARTRTPATCSSLNAVARTHGSTTT